ncbi:hypothetical protein V9T40_002240 [Parthenolecanium corni]|uniref:P21-activated protein kinase-interacting protein 1-like n=1 Tax=Parthenolecanium corni TaxID=536013 RepID=A0AAN9Y4A1_9HEMI
MAVANDTLVNCTFEVIVGTYEEFVLGYIFQEESKELTESFAVHSHHGSVRCVTACDNFLASGGSDEIIQLYSMISRKSVGSIMQHTGTVTDLKFTPEKCHLISCSEDGSIAVYRIGSWQVEKVWTSAHKGAGVSAIDVHPSSKMALSMGQNKTLRTWNLVKGRPAYTTNLSSLGKFMDSVVWSIRGTYFAIIVDTKIHVFDVNVAGIVAAVDCSTRVTCLSFLQDDIICFGEVNGSVICFNITSNSELWRTKVGDSRVKCINCVMSKWIIVANSDGNISVLHVPDVQTEPVQLSSVNCGCRITCMDVRLPVEVKSCNE